MGKAVLSLHSIGHHGTAVSGSWATTAICLENSRILLANHLRQIEAEKAGEFLLA
jgi:hypothetical protein